MSIPKADQARINAILNLLDRVVQKKYVSNGRVGLTEQTRVAAREATVAHHKKFVDRFIDQNKVDPYKLVSWYGFFLTMHADDPSRHILEACLRTLNQMLLSDIGRGLSEEHIIHLFTMAKLDGHTDEFGIGKNGVYSVFSSCVDLARAFKGALVIRQAYTEDTA